MDLFNEKLVSRSQLQRAAITYGKIVGQHLEERSRDQIIQNEVAEYESSKGGIWNYDDLLTGLVQIGRGGSVEALKDYLGGLKGLGEANAKTTLLKELVERTPITKGQIVNVGARRVALGDDVFLLVSYDASVLYDNVVYCYFIYPRSIPLKEKARRAIINEFSLPFSGMDKPHRLVFVENPIVSKRRKPSSEFVDLEFRAADEGFREHLRASRLVMGD